MVTDAQVRLLRQKRMDGKTQVAAGAAAGMSERSARTWEKGPAPSERRGARGWRTRPDPFEGFWESEIVPLLQRDEKGVLESKTLLGELRRKLPERFSESHLRTLQRRVRDWRALNGPPKEVFFEQKHVPGREAAVDFTHATELDVTVKGVPLVHMLFELVLSFSAWTSVCVAFGETFEALVAGVQDSFWELGGVTEVLRSDNLSAATHELKRSGGRTLTSRFKGVLDHYRLQSTRIQPGESHENGVVEQRHYRTKRALAQALVLRGSRDFASLDEYEAFVRSVVRQGNERIPAEVMEKERAALRPLPPAKIPSYTTYRPPVRCWSTIRVGGRSYSVPSRLIGHEVEARLHADVIEVWYAGNLVETMPRLRGEGSARIDYRHVIWSLVTKPGAFARYRYREELFPSTVFRRTYDALRSSRGDRADVEYVRILHLAASISEPAVEQVLEKLLVAGTPFDYAAVRGVVSPRELVVPTLAIPKPDLTTYDALLGGVR
jgi:hypothetical protein